MNQINNRIKQLQRLVQKTYKVSQSGFSLIELILYIALVSIFISSAVLLGWDIIYAGQKADIQREVNQNIRLVAKRIAYEVRNASAIQSITTTSICLTSADTAYNPTYIYLSSGLLRIAWGGGSNDCTNMTNDHPLTNPDVQVTNLVFSDLSNGADTQHVGYELTIESTGVRQEWQHAQTIQGSVELRSN